jgi:hypothetical protein
VIAAGQLAGFAMSRAFIVFRALTTRAAGKARWIRSPSESVLATSSDGGMPREKSRALEVSTRTLPSRLASPASRRASSEAAPAVALTTSSLARLRALAREADLRAPEALADQLLLLMDGAWVAARMFGPGNRGAQVAAAGTSLIDAHRRPEPVEPG